MAEKDIQYKRGVYPQLETSMPQAFARELDKVALAIAEMVKILKDHEARITILEP